MADRNRYCCIESFCGAGGMSLGLLSAGIDVRFAFDIDSFAVKTYRSNIAPHAEVMDIRQTDGRKLLDRLGVDTGLFNAPEIPNGAMVWDA